MLAGQERLYRRLNHRAGAVEVRAALSQIDGLMLLRQLVDFGEDGCSERDDALCDTGHKAES